MKKIINYSFIILGMIIISLFNLDNVYAATKINKASSGWYFERANAQGERHYSGTLKNYTLDGKVAYCIEPGVTDNGSVNETNWSNTGLSDEIKEKVTLIGYYGYTYPNHNTKQYRAATQCMIWETIMGEGAWCKINTQHWSAGTDIDLTNERNEINRLISNHYKNLSFNNKSYNVQKGSPTALTDTNNVLSEFNVINSNIDYQIEGNKISFTPINSVSISFSKKLAYDSDFRIFTSDKIQNMMIPGNVDPIYAKVVVDTYLSSVEINKKDIETGTAHGSATLKGAVYGIYNSNNELITEVTTNENGIAKTDNIFEYGNYYVKEIGASEGYLLDNTKYDFELKDKETITVNVKEQVIKANIKVNKVYVSAKTNENFKEPNVKFELYDNSNNKIKEVITDENGEINLTLPYGKYRLHQITTTKGYKLAEDYNFEVKDTKDINKTIYNEEVTAKLKVIKIDSETKKVIKRANIKFKIFDVNNNEYVCFNNICEFKTNSNGIMVTPNVLYSGKYILEEVDQKIDGYLWNSESIIFEIDENSNLITDNEEGILFETKFENKRVLGSLEITKIGEELQYNEIGYQYNKIPLENVKIGLYKDNRLIKEYTTDKEGKIKINNLELEEYSLKELETSNGNILSDKEYKVSIKYKDQHTPVVNYKITIDNYLPKGTLEFTKTDISKTKSLPNTLMEIYTLEDDKLIFSGRTDENGQIIINDLPIGKYYLVEKEAPKGYVINPEHQEFEILENGEIVKSIMHDEMIIKVPKTDKIVIPDFVYVIVLAILFIGLMIYETKRKK